jgi:hypothetical protein
MALESITDMLSVVLTKVLWPVLTALGQAIVNGIAYAFSGGLLGSNKPVSEYNPSQDYGSMIQQDVTDLMGIAGTGFGDVINTFGLTIQTGNKMIGNSFAESATVLYAGSADIANGFQSVHDVLVIGTTKAIQKVNDTFNLAGAGLVTTINTITTSFEKLIPLVPKVIKDFSDTHSTVTETKTSPVPQVKLAGDWRSQIYQLQADPELRKRYMEGQLANMQKPMAGGGIITHPTNILAGEAGAEVIIPLNKATGFGKSPDINIHFHGDIYGMDDFERQVQAIVGKYSGRVRGAY